MTALGAAGRELAAQLADATGYPAEVDPERLDAPGILVVPGAITADRLAAGILSAEWDVYLTVSAALTPTEALDALGAMLTKVAAVAPIPAAEPVALNIGAGVGLPALRFTLTTEVS